MNTDGIILGSASERRKSIMAGLGVHFEVVIPEVDELFYPNDPQRTAIENALRKNQWCRRLHPRSSIISADTVIDFDGRCMTKPVSMSEAVSFFNLFSGKKQTILTAVALSTPKTAPETYLEESSVRFKNLSLPQIHRYFEKVSPLDKAGAYDINQYRELIIEEYSGSYTNIMGLPEKLIEQWLLRQGLKQ